MKKKKYIDRLHKKNVRNDSTHQFFSDHFLLLFLTRFNQMDDIFKKKYKITDVKVTNAFGSFYSDPN